MIYDSMAFRVQVLRRASPLLVGLLAFRELGSEVSPVGLIRVWNFGFRDSGFRCGIKLWSGVIPRRSLINRIPVHKNRLQSFRAELASTSEPCNSANT